MVPYLPESYQTAHRKLRSVLVGTTATSPLWLRCASHTEGTLPDVVGALYVDKYFSEADKRRVGSGALSTVQCSQSTFQVDLQVYIAKVASPYFSVG